MAETNGVNHDREATLVSSPPVSPSQSQNPPFPRVIPPEHPFRTLVLCFDGTGDQFDSDNSNIVQFFSLLKKDDKSKQLVYYQAGIGTYTAPQVATPLFSKFSKMLDEAVAWNLHSHVMSGYEFLMQNYNAGDRICIFGFSRGAYTARSLAGMIHKVGILPKCNHQQVPFAYKMYTQTDDLGWKQSNAFKKAFSIDADIEFVGVWDTVSSVGLIPRTLPFATSNTIVCTFRHAISLDEHRAKFKANHWNRPNKEEETLSISDQDKKPPPHPEHRSNSLFDYAKSLSKYSPIKYTEDSESHRRQKVLEKDYSKDRNAPTDVDEVWFSGCHCDVGGGSVDNSEIHNLARITLRWMIRECFKTKSGIMFDADGLRELGMEPMGLWPEVKPRPAALPLDGRRILPVPKGKMDQAQVLKQLNFDPNVYYDTVSSPGDVSSGSRRLLTEEELELIDSLQPVYDQLSMKWFWWILEFWPIKQRYQKSDNSWVSYLGFNLGKARFIPHQKTQGIRIHRSVKTRMEALHKDGSKYVPKAQFDLEHVTWVD